MVSVHSGIPHLSERLDRLFATVPAPTRRGRYSNDTAADALAERGVTVTGVHLSHLRTGRRDNPSARLLSALADLFDVPLTYFLDDDTAQNIEADLRALHAIRNARVRALVERIDDLSPRSVGHLEAIVDQLRQIEGIDPEDAAGGAC